MSDPSHPTPSDQAQPATDESFAAMFEKSQHKKRRRVQPGDKVVGRVMNLSSRRALLDLGDGLDAMIESTEFGDDPTPLQVGDSIEGYVLRIENRVVVVGRSLGKGAGNAHLLEQAFISGIPIEGQVKEVNKG